MALSSSIQEKLTTIAENEQRVYDSGVDEGEGNIWDEIQGVNGTRTDYDCFFRLWKSDYIRPKHKVVPKRGTGTINKNLRMVFENASIKKIESRYFDFSNMTFSTSASNTDSLYGFFRNCSQLEEIEDIGLNAGGYYQTYNRCPKLHTIAVMRCVKDGTYNGSFTQCYELANITIEGEIGNDITFKDCSKLTIESLKSIITALVDYSGTDSEYAYTLTLNNACITTLEEAGMTSPNGNTWVEYIDDKKWNLTTA